MKRPLIHVLSNHASLMYVADGILAYGGSPICSETIQEFHDLYKHVDALYVNLGMMDMQKVNVITKACEIAAQNDIPIGIDPAGIHMSSWRLKAFDSILKQFPIAYVRANSREATAYIHQTIEDSEATLESFKPIDIALMKKHFLKDRKVWFITGKEDHVIGHDHYVCVSGGSALLTDICGAGCLVSALVAVNLIKGFNAFDSARLVSHVMKDASMTAGADAYKYTLIHELSKRRHYDLSHYTF